MYGHIWNEKKIQQQQTKYTKRILELYKCMHIREIYMGVCVCVCVILCVACESFSTHTHTHTPADA